MSCKEERGEVKLRLVMVMRAIFLHKHRSMVALDGSAAKLDLLLHNQDS
jgi:hypothetical protein